VKSFRPSACLFLVAPEELQRTNYFALLTAVTLESNTEKVALAPNQATHANGPETVKGQREVKGDDLKVLGADAGTNICNVAYGTRVYTDPFIEKY